MTDQPEGPAPRPYSCTGCGAHGVKLWRDYQTFADQTRLLCLACGNAAMPNKPEQSYPNNTDTIGWLVPAVPAGDTFWGYTSVPQDRVEWWKALPDAPSPSTAPEGEVGGLAWLLASGLKEALALMSLREPPPPDAWLREMRARIAAAVPDSRDKLIGELRERLAQHEAGWLARERGEARDESKSVDWLNGWEHYDAEERADAAESTVASLRAEVDGLKAERVICAAVQMPDGAVFNGHRHGHAIQASQDPPKYKGVRPVTQGFTTSVGRFVDRREGLRLQLALAIKSASEHGYNGEELFSEDLY